jgi:hypothetical protein
VSTREQIDALVDRVLGMYNRGFEPEDAVDTEDSEMAEKTIRGALQLFIAENFDFIFAVDPLSTKEVANAIDQSLSRTQA